MSDATFFNQFREIVLTAERSLLYALGFQLDIGHPYYWTSTILKRLSAIPGVGEDWARYSKRTVRSYACMCFLSVILLGGSPACQLQPWVPAHWLLRQEFDSCLGCSQMLAGLPRLVIDSIADA